jgi:hypothetical protein
MNPEQTLRRLPVAVALAAALCAVSSATATSLERSRLEVRLLDKHSGKPVAGAAVCLGTRAQASQFGARRSDADGVVRFDDVRTSPLLLTVSGQGYQGRQQALEPMYQSRVMAITLVTGGGGPTCAAPRTASNARAADSGLALTSVRVRANPALQEGAGALVTARASGSVNQIRISEHADFHDTDWQDYGPEIAVPLSGGEGLKRLYVQVRRATVAQGASIEVLSPVREVSYRVQ